VTDDVAGPFDLARARLHVHPDVRVTVTDERHAELVTRSGRVVRVSTDAGSLAREPAVWHPEFGLDLDSRVLVAAFHASSLTTEIRWQERP
jgi:uncharacterized heparinase superfamily protein